MFCACKDNQFYYNSPYIDIWIRILVECQCCIQHKAADYFLPYNNNNFLVLTQALMSKGSQHLLSQLKYECQEVES